MLSRTKILVVDQDIHSLSKIYLNLLHRNYKVEVSDSGDELPALLKKLKPSILIIHHEFYRLVEKKLKIPAIILTEQYTELKIREQGDVKILNKPIQTDHLLTVVKSLEV